MESDSELESELEDFFGGWWSYGRRCRESFRNRWSVTRAASTTVTATTSAATTNRREIVLRISAANLEVIVLNCKRRSLILQSEHRICQ